MSQETQSQKEKEINQAWSQYKWEQRCVAPSKNEVFKMRERGQI